MKINQQSKVPMHTENVPSDPGASQGARRATEDAPGSAPSPIPPGSDSEVVPRARRRTFTNADKRRILQAADLCTMRSKPVASLLVDLDVAKSHSRPHVSDDNPYSEWQFKTMKYRPAFPQRFGCIEDARAHCQAFFAWYNAEHCQSGIGYMTPHSVHYGLAADLRVIRQDTLDAAFLANPNWFKNKRPQLPPMPAAVWINPPPEEKTPTSKPVARTLN